MPTCTGAGEEFWLPYLSQYISFHGFVASGS
jgi:hypothetical protein